MPTFKAIVLLLPCLLGLGGVSCAAPLIHEKQKMQINVGGIGMLRPAYEGSSHYRTRLFPMVDLRYGSLFFNVRQGLGVQLVRRDAVSLSASLGYRFGRDEGDSPVLTNMGDIDGGLTAAVAAKWNLPPVFVQANLEQTLFKTNTGALLKLSLGRAFFWKNGWTFIPSGELQLADKRYMQTYFGVSESQSRRTTFAPYHPEAGIKSLGLNLRAMKKLSTHWSLALTGGAERLVGGSQGSPLVREKLQRSLTLGALYSF